MSIAAMSWAFALDLKPATVKFVLVALADNSDDEGRAFPSLACLISKTSLDRKTVIGALDQLEQGGLLRDTGGRVGQTKQVKVYRLIGFGMAFKGTESGTFEGSQERNPSKGETVPFFPPNSTVPPTKQYRKRYPESSSNHQEPSEGERARAAPAARSRRCPTDFVVTEDLVKWAEREAPGVDLAAETHKFRDHEFDPPKSDWAACWRQWMRRAPEFKPRNGSRLEDTGWKPDPNDPRYVPLAERAAK